MVGVVLNDEENPIAEHMEHDLRGEFIDVKCSAKNGVSGSIVSLEDMGRISRKIDSLIEQMGVELHMGKIMQNPVNSTNHNNTCEFCDYSSVCANRKEIELKEIEELSFSDTLKKIGWLSGEEKHLFPFRTEKLSSLALMVLHFAGE